MKLPFCGKSAGAVPPGKIIQYQAGDSLKSVARREYGDESKWTVIFDANAGRIGEPAFLYPSGDLVIPDLRVVGRGQGGQRRVHGRAQGAPRTKPRGEYPGGLGRAMWVRADVTCFLCGHVAGWIEGDDATLSLHHAFHPDTAPDWGTLRAHGRLRCARCDGSVFFGEPEPVRTRGGTEVTAADFAAVAVEATSAH